MIKNIKILDFNLGYRTIIKIGKKAANNYVSEVSKIRYIKK
jgi:hypothetical protein